MAEWWNPDPTNDSHFSEDQRNSIIGDRVFSAPMTLSRKNCGEVHYNKIKNNFSKKRLIESNKYLLDLLSLDIVPLTLSFFIILGLIVI